MFKYSISIQKSEILVDEEDDSVGNLKVVEFELISKPETSLPIENTKTQSVGERTFFQDLATALEDIKEDCLELDADSANSKMLISVLDPKISDIFDSNFGTISIDGCSTIISTLECSNLDANESTSQAGM